MIQALNSTNSIENGVGLVLETIWENNITLPTTECTPGK